MLSFISQAIILFFNLALPCIWTRIRVQTNNLHSSFLRVALSFLPCFERFILAQNVGCLPRILLQRRAQRVVFEVNHPGVRGEEGSA
jgi:hypothetical protein